MILLLLYWTYNLQVSEFAPPNYQRALSYSVGESSWKEHATMTDNPPGWLSAMGWQTWLADLCFVIGTVIQGLVAFNVPDYEPKSWHGSLLSIAAVALVSISFLGTLFSFCSVAINVSKKC